MKALIILGSVLYLSLSACQSGGGGGGGSDGGGSGGKSSASIYGGGESSTAKNPAEEREYKRALLRCYKTGGSRIVKILGKLRCY